MVLKYNTEGKNTTVERLYENDNWVVDKLGDSIRISYFENNHFVDELIIVKEVFEEN